MEISPSAGAPPNGLILEPFYVWEAASIRAVIPSAAIISLFNVPDNPPSEPPENRSGTISRIDEVTAGDVPAMTTDG